LELFSLERKGRLLPGGLFVLAMDSGIHFLIAPRFGGTAVPFLSLFNIPLGTAVCLYSLWVLLPATSDRDYEEQVRAA
jgi:hypothetical protein